MREPQIERAGRGEAGAEPAVSALNDEQPRGLTGRAGLPAEIGVQARYERLAVTHATTLGQLPTLSIDFIDNVSGRRADPVASRITRRTRRRSSCRTSAGAR